MALTNAEDPVTLFKLAYSQISKSRNFLPAFFGGFFTGFQNNAPIYILKVNQTPAPTPNIKAIARIGLEAGYWQVLAHRIVQEGFNAAQPLQMFLPCLLPDATSQFVVMKSLNQDEPYYLRLGQTNTFYELLANKVVLVDTTGEQTVPLADFGAIDISSLIADRKNIDLVIRRRFVGLLQTLIKENSDLQMMIRQYNLQELIKLIDSREELTWRWEQQLVNGDFYYFILEHIDAAMRQEIRTEGLNNELVRTINIHALAVADLYQKVQEMASKKSLYPYPILAVDKFILLPS